MSGLEKIIAAIEGEAKENAAAILEEAQKNVEAIEREAAEKEAALKKNFFAGVEAECKQIIDRLASDDRQKRKGYLLKVRSDVIEQVIQEARAKVEALPEREYFQFLHHVFINNALPEEGVIRFAQHDAARLPADFIERCNAALENGSVTLGEPVSGIRAGFLIVYGKVEQNCSIESIFESNKNMLFDKVNECLTAGI